MDFHSLMGRASIMMTGKRNDDGISDRLNYRYTVGILIVLGIINMNRIYTDQIKCWVNHFVFYITFLYVQVDFRLIDSSIFHSEL